MKVWSRKIRMNMTFRIINKLVKEKKIAKSVNKRKFLLYF